VPNLNPDKEREYQQKEDEVTLEYIKKDGKVVDSKLGVYSLYCQEHEKSYTYAYAVRNESKHDVFFTLDLTKSKHMVCSEPTLKVQRLIESGQFLFMCNLEAAEGYEEYIRGVEVTYADEIEI